MDDFNAYPNRGEAYTPEFAQKKDTDNEERQDVEKYRALYERIIEDFTTAIEQLSSIDQITDTEHADIFMVHVRANKIAKQFIENERNSLESVIGQYKK